MTATISPPPRPPRRRIVRLLIWGAGLLVALAAALALFLSTLDAAIYQRALEAELSDVLDRPVSVRSVSFAVSLFPTLSARDLRIANPPWASRPDFVTAGEAGSVRCARGIEHHVHQHAAAHAAPVLVIRRKARGQQRLQGRFLEHRQSARREPPRTRWSVPLAR